MHACNNRQASTQTCQGKPKAPETVGTHKLDGTDPAKHMMNIIIVNRCVSKGHLLGVGGMGEAFKKQKMHRLISVLEIY